MACSNIPIKQIPDGNVHRLLHEEFVYQFCDGFLLIGDEETCLPKSYADFAQTIQNFEVHDDDVMVCTFPKSGTTWAQEMVWLISNDFDYEGAKSDLMQRFPFLEISALCDHQKRCKSSAQTSPLYITDSIKYTQQLKRPRFIKSHLPFSLLPQDIQNGTKSPKIIYVIRNSKDVCVSYYHHARLMHGMPVSLENFCKVFLAETTMYGSYWKHVLGFWKRRSEPNLLIITYEGMKKDLPSVIKKVAHFLNKTLTEEQIRPLCEHLSFDSMKNNPAVNYEERIEMKRKQGLLLEEGRFMRSGTVGKYKEEMSLDFITQFDEWNNKNIDGTDFNLNLKL